MPRRFQFSLKRCLMATTLVCAGIAAPKYLLWPLPDDMQLLAMSLELALAWVGACFGGALGALIGRPAICAVAGMLAVPVAVSAPVAAAIWFFENCWPNC
jgi:hypothetical protein